MFFLINSKAKLDASTGILCSQFFINFVYTSTFSLIKKSFASSKKLGPIVSKSPCIKSILVLEVILSERFFYLQFFLKIQLYIHNFHQKLIQYL